jgi:membrane protein DedA with SNARE-associated domain
MVVVPEPAFFSGLTERVTDIIERLGYIGIAGLIALENVFPPIPSEIILPLAGFMAGRGDFWLPAVVVAATIGSVVGALVLYAVGAWLGDKRLRQLVNRYGRFLGVHEHDLDRANNWFDRYGSTAVFLGRLVPVIRSIVSVPAGIRRMSLGQFLLYTAVGSTIWNGVLIGLGWALGDHWEQVGDYVSYFQYVVILAIVVAVGVFFWRRRLSKRVSDRG